MKINTEVSKGYTVYPAPNGGMTVQNSTGDELAAFTSPEDLLVWLAASHQAKLLVIDPSKIDVQVMGTDTDTQKPLNFMMPVGTKQ